MKRANIIPIPFPRRDETPFQAPSLQLTVGTVPCVTPCLLSNEGSCYFCANSYPLVPPKLKPMRPGSLRQDGAWEFGYLPSSAEGSDTQQSLRSTGLRKSKVRKQIIGRFQIKVQFPSQIRMFYTPWTKLVLKYSSIVLESTAQSIKSQMFTGCCLVDCRNGCKYTFTQKPILLRITWDTDVRSSGNTFFFFLKGDSGNDNILQFPKYELLNGSQLTSGF